MNLHVSHALVGGYIANLLDFYSYSLIGKLTAFLQRQEFSQRNQTWENSSTFAAQLFLQITRLIDSR